MNNTTTQYNPTKTGIDLINIRRVLYAMLRNWYLYLIFLIISVIGAILYLKTTIPNYLISARIMVDQERSPGEDILQGFELRPGLQNLENQIIILSSYNMIRKTVDELPFEIDVYRKGLMSQASYYPLSPLRITEGEDGLPYNNTFEFKYLDSNRFRLTSLSAYGSKMDTILFFSQEIQFDEGSFIIEPQSELESEYKSGSKIYIQFLNKDQLTQKYMSRLQIRNQTREGSIINISLQGPNRIKDIVFLNKLTEIFINDNLEKKNLEAKRIIDFINSQLVSVSDSLTLTETELQEFRSRNRIMDVSAQSQQIVSQVLTLENEKARLNLERNYYNYLEEYLESDEYTESAVMPAAIGIDDQMLIALMQDMAGLQAEFLSSGIGDRNPLQGQLEMRIENTKKNIWQIISSNRRANEMAIDENNRQIWELDQRASRLPEKERQLLGFERRFNLNNVLYTLLLQRRAEAQIQSASSTPDYELVDPARATGPISPDQHMVIVLAIALTLAIPTLGILITNLFQNRVVTEEDLEAITKLPVVAYLPHSRISYNTVVLTEPTSNISEAFRSLRTRLDFYTQDSKCPLIVLTSSIPSEGKSFCSVNLASAYSLSGKKTLLIGLDLRRPTLKKSFSISTDIGITSYFIGKNDLEDVIYDTGYENLHIIPAGPIPPNPGELVGSKKALESIEVLKEKYDCIIVDSPPIGIVADIYPIASRADVVLLPVRHGLTDKRALRGTLSEMEFHKIKNVSLLLNDIRTGGRRYSYSYKYKYEYKNKSNPNQAKDKKKASKSENGTPLKTEAI
ncbi:MAG: polysaccharide biosynthesis tyrosine autokinase [Bacteroidales bacterium]|nr:polysaccharide biosynthesis tyrosine autokinase [Bacteroidales bacterium]